MMVNQPEFFDDAIAAATRIAEEHAATGKESPERLDTYLQRSVPDLSKLLQRDQVLAALWKFCEGLSELIQEKQNSIWSFVIRNSYRPAMLRQQFDVIIGNPPWVAYRYVTDPDYQKEIKERAVTTYKIAPRSQSLFTQMELATVFLAHSMQTFARPGGKLAFVMPRSVLTADQHQNLIQRKYTADFRLTGYWDLWDVAPLFNVPCCVLFAEQSKRHGSAKDEIPAQTWTAHLPDRDVPWDKVANKFSITTKPARVIWLGGRSALSDKLGASSETKPSAYSKIFKTGATIYPRNLFFVSIEGLKGKPDPARLYYAKTDEAIASESKKPYQQVRMAGNVEGRFLFGAAISKDVLPFTMLEPCSAALPLEESNGSYYTLTTQALERKGFRDFAKWMKSAETIWIEKRGAKSQSQTLLQRIDYQKGLTAQSPKHRHLVLYNAAGTNVSATYCDRDALNLPLLVEHKLYWGAFNSEEEAWYVTAILNSVTVNDAIKPFQSTGLLGERDIEKKLLDVPIPLFVSTNPTHKTLVLLGERAHQEAQAALKSADFPSGPSLARQRSFIRKALEDTLGEIDGLVKVLLGIAA
jgi:hypothetical protein